MNESEAYPGTLRGHYVICNWNDLGDQIVRQLHAPVVGAKHPIVVVTDQPDAVPMGNEEEQESDPYHGVFVVVGNPTSEAVLARADVRHANTAIVLSDSREGEHADTKSVLIALAVEAIEPRVHTIVELLHSRNRIHFRHTYVDEIVCMDELTEKLLAQSAITHGISEFYLRLLTATEDTNEVYVAPVPSAFIGRSYRDLELALIKSTDVDVILVGCRRLRPAWRANRKSRTTLGGR